MLSLKTFRIIPAGLLASLLVVAIGATPAAAEAVMKTRKGASYEDVRLDVETAIISAGLKIDYTGNIGAMLTRTGPDVGSNQPVYKNAEFFTFCSAKLSRQMMEADPANMQHCPYVVFIYQRAATVNEIVVGYRKLDEKGRGKQVLGEINKLLDRIVTTATK
ncbi:MAG: DUF302 domain-containing protein [Hyphomicrobiaceae bacterium]